jgi:NADPH-dependent 2,4-dienoyl-CoA reductase/sulfur reductase-like enzyme
VKRVILAKRDNKREPKITLLIALKGSFSGHFADTSSEGLTVNEVQPEDLIEITPEEFEQKRSIPIRRMHEVVEIDYKNGYVTADDLVNHRSFKEQLDYMMIATGATGKTLGVGGEKLRGVHTLRTVEDAISIRNSTRDAEDIVICGGGYIGLETAEAFVSLGKHVTILKKTSQMLLNSDAEMSSLVEDEVRSKGVTNKY